MSPEQCRGSGKLDHRTDIYSLAVILFEMISGQPPFMAEGVGELFAKHMLEPAPSLAEVAPRTPPHVVRAVMRALAKNLEDRPPTMKAFAEALNGRGDVTAPGVPRAASQISSMAGAHPTMVGRPSEEATTLSSAAAAMGVDTLAVPKRSRKGLFVVLAVAVVAAGGGIFAMQQRQQHAAAPQPPPPVVEAPAPPEPAKPAEPEQVDIRFESEPDGAHVLRKIEGKDEPEDLGTAPLDLKLDKSEQSTQYVLHADGFQDRGLKIDASRDRVLHLALDRLPPQPDKKAPKAAPARPARPRKPVIHDADGLAIPSF
jgi:serine/threonine-protein kinase